MITRDELAGVFGSDLVTLNFAEARRNDLTIEDAETLANIGLPRSGSIFTTQVVGEPVLFTLNEFEVDDEYQKTLVVGGPPGDAQMRYFLDAYEGYVGLIALDEDQPQMEIINTTLEAFLEFVYRFERATRLDQVTPVTIQRQKAELIEQLRRVDEFALSRPDSWWSMAIDRIDSLLGDR